MTIAECQESYVGGFINHQYCDGRVLRGQIKLQSE